MTLPMLRFPILFLLCLTACSYKEEQAPASAVLGSIIILATPLEGDGESRALVQVSFPPETPREKTTVEFRTTAGIFDDSDKDIATVSGELVPQPDGTFRRVAQATLIAPQRVGKAQVFAKSSGYQISSEVPITPAFADSLTLTADKISVKSAPDSEIKFTAQLFRKTGKPSLDRVVELKVVDEKGYEVGQFREIKNRSDANGQVSFAYTLGVSSYVGPLTATATYKEGGRNLSRAFVFTSIK